MKVRGWATGVEERDVPVLVMDFLALSSLSLDQSKINGLRIFVILQFRL